jgi:transcription elongation factor Elf1
MRYPFWCECGKHVVIEASMAERPTEGDVACPSCGAEMFRDFSGIQVDVFQPFTDPNLDVKPVHFSSKRERDAYLKANNLTYDNVHWHRRPTYKPATDTVTLDEVMGKLKNEGAPTEELVEDPGEIAGAARFDDPAAS